MNREEMREQKARELQEKLIEETFRETFQSGDSKYIMQPYEFTMMKGATEKREQTIFEQLHGAFQNKYQEQIGKIQKKENGQFSLWDNPVPPIRVKFTELEVRPDEYNELHLAAIEMGKRLVEIPGINEDGDLVINYMPLFAKVSVPVTELETKRSIGATRIPYKNNTRRKGYIEFTINQEVGHEYFEIKQKYTKYIKGVPGKCKCKYSSQMYKWAAHWRDMGGKWEISYIDFRRLLGFRQVTPVVHDNGRTSYEEVDVIYSDFGEVKRFVLDKAQAEVKKLADKNEIDCYFTYTCVMPLKSNGKRSTRGNPEKIVFNVHLSQLGEYMRRYNNIQQKNIQLEYLMMKELRMSKQSASSLTARLNDEIRPKFNTKVMDLIKYVIDPNNKIKDRGGYSFMALSNFLDEHATYATEVTPEKSPTKIIELTDSNTSTEPKEPETIKSVWNLSANDMQKWFEMLEEIRGKLDADKFNAWIVAICPLSLVENVITFGVPNDFFYETIYTSYLPSLMKYLKKTYSEDIKVKFEKIDSKDTDLWINFCKTNLQ